MSLKRKQVKKMLDRVEKDGVMWAIKRKGKVVAVVLDWQTWQLLNRKLHWYQQRHESYQEVQQASQQVLQRRLQQDESRRDDENLHPTGQWPVDAGGSVGNYVALGVPHPREEPDSGIPSRQD